MSPLFKASGPQKTNYLHGYMSYIRYGLFIYTYLIASGYNVPHCNMQINHKNVPFENLNL